MSNVERAHALNQLKILSMTIKMEQNPFVKHHLTMLVIRLSKEADVLLPELMELITLGEKEADITLRN